MESIKVYPSAEELTTVSRLLYCTEAGCPSIFKSESNLNLHLVKRHKKEELAGFLDKQDSKHREYHCPETDCIYNLQKYFKSKNLLKQHYLKVHGERDNLCAICSKGFPTEPARNSHQEYCGINFKCCECDANYTCYDTLTTHGRRKKHKILPKSNYKQLLQSTSFISIPVVLKEPLLLPKLSASELLFSVNMTDKSSQTDLRKMRKREKRRHNSRETQTSKNKHPQLSAETQTIGDYISRKSSCDVSSSSSTESLGRKSINTQTASVSSITKSCNTSFNLSEIEFSDSDIEKTTSATQTLAQLPHILSSYEPNDFEFMNSSCQTSFTEHLEPFDSDNYFNCHIETQTDFMSNEFDLLDPDYYTNMCTQTCDDVLNSDMEFNNIHTQTMDDLLRSVGSQTTMSVNTTTAAIACRDIAHNHTQTDVAYKQMLEEINA